MSSRVAAVFDVAVINITGCEEIDGCDVSSRTRISEVLRGVT